MKQKTKSGFAVYVNSKEKIQLAIIKRNRRRKMRIGLAVALVICCGLLFLAYEFRVYHEVKVLNSLAQDESDISKGFSYKDGLIIYNEDGLSYVDKSGKISWTKTYSIANPVYAYCDDYIAIASKNGNEVALCDDNGKVLNFSVSNPIADVEVSGQGVTAVMLDGGDENYIELYDASGKKLVSLKSNISQKGYLMDMALSDDGQELGVSYLKLEKGKTVSRIYFYNFGDEGQQKKDRLMAKYTYKGMVIPKVRFTSRSTFFAVADKKLILFKGGVAPQQQRMINFVNDIKSIVANDNYLAVVTDTNQNSKEKYCVKVFASSGTQVMNHKFSMDYSNVTLGDKEIIFTTNNHCYIFSFQGHKYFDKKFDQRIVQVAASGEDRRYLFTYENSSNFVRLR